MSNTGNYPTTPPGEGTWSVFAEKVVRERDDLIEALDKISSDLAETKAERDGLRTQLSAVTASRDELRAELDDSYDYWEMRAKGEREEQEEREERDKLRAIKAAALAWAAEYDDGVASDYIASEILAGRGPQT